MKKSWLVINVGCCGTDYRSRGSEWPAAEEGPSDRVSIVSRSSY